jgi:hypothetical protein
MMQTVEDFMRRYFEERILQEKEEQARRALFLRKFIAEGCHWSSRRGYLEMLQSERVLSIEPSDQTALVVTCRENAGMLGVTYELRYHLQAKDGGWLICEVDLRCCACSGTPGKPDCQCCHGTGWRGTNAALAGPSSRAASGTCGSTPA